MMLWQCAKLVGTTALHCCSTMPFDAGKMEEKGAKKCPKGVRYQNTPHIDRYTGHMEENCQLFDGLLSKLFKLVMFQSLVSFLGLVFEILSSSTTFFKPIYYM